MFIVAISPVPNLIILKVLILFSIMDWYFEVTALMFDYTMNDGGNKKYRNYYSTWV